jgi:hypothetical protein
MKLRTCAIFASEAFNTTTTKPEFIHPENYGDDLARWFMDELRSRQIAVDEGDPSQEDHGWYVTFTLNARCYDIVFICAPANDGAARWLACIENSVGVFGTMLGLRHRAVPRAVVELVKDILVHAEECRDTRWLYFEDVHRGTLENDGASPDS